MPEWKEIEVGWIIRGPDEIMAIVRAMNPAPTPANDLFFGLGRDHQIRGITHSPSRKLGALAPCRLVEIADALCAACLVRVEIRTPGAAVLPNDDQLDGYRAWRDGCMRYGVLLLDHLLVAGDRWRSLSEFGARQDAARATSWPSTLR